MLLLAAALVGGVGVALAADDSPSPAAGSEKVVFRVGTIEPPDNLNPFVGYGTIDYEAWCLNYDFIIGYGPDGEPVPGIAESWEVSDDGLVWTLKIRQGAVWSDGEPVTAEDVAFSYNYIVEKDLYAYSSYTKLIDEARGRRRLHLRGALQRAQGQHGAALHLLHPGAHLVQDRRPREAQGHLPVRRLGALPDRRSGSGAATSF